MKKYYYMIPYDDVVYDMINYSLISCDMNPNPNRSCVIAYKETLRCIEDVSDPNFTISYLLIPMDFDFSTPFKGEHAYTTDEMRVILNEPRWQHNNLQEV